MSALDRIRNKRKLENKLFTDEINKENLLKRNNVSIPTRANVSNQTRDNVSDTTFSIIDNWNSTDTPKHNQSSKVEESQRKERYPYKYDLKFLIFPCYFCLISSLYMI